MVIESFESSKNLQQGFPAVKVYTSRWRRLALNKTGQYCCWSQYCQILANTGQKEILLVTIQDNVGKYWLEKYCLQDTQQRFLFTLGEICQHCWQSQFMTGMKRRMNKRRMMSVRLSDWQEALLKSAEHEMRSETELCGVYQKVVPNQPNQSKAYISRRGEWREVEEKILLICLRRGGGGMSSKGRECQCDVQGCVLPTLAPLIPEGWRTRTGMHETCQGPVPQHHRSNVWKLNQSHCRLRHLSEHLKECPKSPLGSSGGDTRRYKRKAIKLA